MITQTDIARLERAMMPVAVKMAAKIVGGIKVRIPRRDFVFRGSALEIQTLKSPEWIISGPAETGKTIAALHRLHCLMIDHPGSNAVIVRNVRADMDSTVLKTFQDKIISEGIRIYGGEKPVKYMYPNGSTIWVAGMDKAKKSSEASSKVLSAEFDFIYVNQAEELSKEHWETLTTRCTGRAGNAPIHMLFGDCNPGSKNHWIRKRSKSGKLLLLKSCHKDNPALFDNGGAITLQGKDTIGILEGLTGIRYKRLFEGKWAQAEGTVYDGFNMDAHVTTRDSGEFGRWGLALDEGYTNPAVILLIGIDGDGRFHILEEFYRTGVLQSNVVSTAQDMSKGKPLEIVAVDAAAAGLIADLNNNGLPASPHKGRVLDGITLVQDRLKIQGDGKPRLTIDPSCVNTVNEFESYVWKPGKDEPVKRDDHAMDALRYFTVALDYFDDVSIAGWGRGK